MVLQMELSFITAKQSFINIMQVYFQKKQEYAAKECMETLNMFPTRMMVEFLENCSCFQSLSTASQIALLQKNICEISILLSGICYNQENFFRLEVTGDQE